MKYCVEFMIVILILISILPILLILVIVLYVISSGNPIFIQRRIGYKNQEFSLYKFKTMNDKVDELGNKLSDELRITKFGSFLRKCSIDELPQLLNILKGDMSFIGPRPLLPEYLSLYSQIQRKRHNVKPGITGWAQVNGRNTISWKKKFELDVWYIENQSLILDLKILWFTLIKVFKREGVSSQSSVTMEKFRGK